MKRPPLPDGRFWVSEHAKPATAYRRRHHWREAGLGRMAVSLAGRPAVRQRSPLGVRPPGVGPGLVPRRGHRAVHSPGSPTPPGPLASRPSATGPSTTGPSTTGPLAIGYGRGRRDGRAGGGAAWRDLQAVRGVLRDGQPEQPVYLVAVHGLALDQQVGQPGQVTLMGADERDRALFRLPEQPADLLIDHGLGGLGVRPAGQPGAAAAVTEEH